jgi:hypothetical protein
MDFIRDGQTVVLKPNLPTVYQDNGETLASPTVSGISTDWRVTKSVADLVRAKNPTGKILIMEGSTFATNIAYAALGYTTEKFGSSVDEFIALEGASCIETSTTAPRAAHGVPLLTELEADGLGTTDTARIAVVGAKVSDVAKPFAGRQTEICPGN